MTWVLLIFIVSFQGPSTNMVSAVVPGYKTKQACEAAGAAAVKAIASGMSACIPGP